MEKNESPQRIYIGGLDPSRGLTVELVASRLHSVKDVEIISINDVAIKDRGDATTCTPNEPIYNPKHKVLDADGDLIDTRQFFYIEARSTDAASSSAFDLVAKQYHNAKWKGCSLRVEEAKPHFLKRLEQEREERDAKAAAVAAALSAEIKEAHAKEEDCNVDEEGAKEEVKNRRRLRVRERFGAEAFLVDTHPRQLQLGNGSSEGWNDFAFLRKRMIDKRESQRKNLVERRKQERRSWAGGKGNKEHTLPENNDLRSLIFLNRGIHLRFDSNLVSDDNQDVSKDFIEDITEDYESSSVPSSSSSESEESSIRGEDVNQKSYMWSDDDDDNSSAEVRNEKADTDDEFAKRLAKPMKTNNLKAGVDYTKAIAADEFAFGADFDFDPSNDDAESFHSDHNLNAFNESINIDLEDDISSNINVLSKLFPTDHFDSKPLANTNNGGNGNIKGSEDAKEKQKFGAGQIMQRYDPNKDKRYEKVETKEVIQPKEEIEEDDQAEEQREKLSLAEDASVSSESSASLSADDAEEQEEKIAETLTPPSTNTVTEEKKKKEDVYEQDELENVFKQSRQVASTDTAGGFSFGFQVPTEATKPDIEQSNQSTSSFAFGFRDDPKVDKDPTTADSPPVIFDKVEDVAEEKIAPATERVRRVGLSIPESDLDDYEDLFFSLNEGPQILKDLDAMKQDEDNQNLWQKEREQLTSDWKRKQKAAQSRKVKQKRR